MGVKRRRCRPRVRVSADGHGLVTHAEVRLLSDPVARTGLARDLTAAPAPWQPRDGSTPPTTC